MIRHIFLDMDGVLCDFIAGVAKLLEIPERVLKDNHPTGIYGIEHALSKVTGYSAKQAKADMWKAITKAGVDFWANLPKYSWAHSLYGLCQEVAPVTIATSPAICGESACGKVKWLQKEFGEDFRSYLITPGNKHLLAKPNTVLIDDSDANVEAFKMAGGQAILFPMRLNILAGHAPDAESKMRFIDTALWRLKSKQLESPQ